MCSSWPWICAVIKKIKFVKLQKTIVYQQKHDFQLQVQQCMAVITVIGGKTKAPALSSSLVDKIFRCTKDYAKRSFYRTANGIFGTVACEEVTIQLLKSKCLFLLLCARNCDFTKRDIQSLDFTVNRFVIKPFRTSDINVVTECQINCRFQVPNVLLDKHREKFVSVYGTMWWQPTCRSDCRCCVEPWIEHHDNYVYIYYYLLCCCYCV